MARYDKYDSKLSGPRGFLAADWLAADVNTVIGVGYDSSGRIVKGPGQTGVKGILILTRVIKAGREPVDPMKHGEVVEFDRQGPNAAAFAAAPGTNYYVVTATGVLTATASGNKYIGHTVEAGRLIVEVTGP